MNKVGSDEDRLDFLLAVHDDQAGDGFDRPAWLKMVAPLRSTKHRILQVLPQQGWVLTAGSNREQKWGNNV